MTKLGLIARIKAVADAIGGNLQIALGSTGNHVKDSGGVTQSTGKGWDPEPTSFGVLMEGIANHDGQAREMDSSGDLLSTDRRVELTQNSVTVTLPSSSLSEFAGSYVIKSMGVTGGSISGTIDGVSSTIPITGYEFVNLYCNGSGWYTG